MVSSSGLWHALVSLLGLLCVCLGVFNGLSHWSKARLPAGFSKAGPKSIQTKKFSGWVLKLSFQLSFPPPPAPETAVWFNPPLFLHLTVLFVQSLVSALVFCRVRECGERARAGKTLIGEYSSLMCCWWVASGKLLLGDVSLLPNALLRLDFLLVLNLFPVGWCFCVGLALWSTVTPGQNSSGLFSNPREARLADCKPFSNLFALAILNLKGLLFCS